MTELAEYQRLCETAARAGGAVLLDWAGRFEVREKGPADLVTEADLASQKVIQDTLLGAFPMHGFLAEEDAAIPSRQDGLRWVVDPLDGTTNYVHGAPNYAVSVALEQHGKPLVGAVYDPLSEECFTAARGQGAWLNGRRLRVSPVAQMSKALIAASFASHVRRESPEVAEFITVLLAAQATRRMGSSALNLCYLAAGRYDGYWSTTTKAWDIAAGVLLVLEAGGIVTAIDGADFRLEDPRFVAACTSQLHHELSALLEHSAA